MPRTVTLGWDGDGSEAAFLVGLDRAAVEALLVAHPPALVDGQPRWTQEFTDALVASCMGRGEDDLAEVMAGWEPGDWRALTEAAISVSDVDDAIDFSSRIEWDARFREEMSYCAPLGIPHSVFLGRPWPQPGEPLWLPEDREKALAYARWKAEFCVCGTRRREWAKDPYAFVADSDRCPGCELIEVEQAQVAKLQEDDRRGVKSFLKPRPAEA